MSGATPRYSSLNPGRRPPVEGRIGGLHQGAGDGEVLPVAGVGDAAPPDAVHGGGQEPLQALAGPKHRPDEASPQVGPRQIVLEILGRRAAVPGIGAAAGIEDIVPAHRVVQFVAAEHVQPALGLQRRVVKDEAV